MRKSKPSGTKSVRSTTPSTPPPGFTPDEVTRPAHYTRDGVELTQIVEAYGLGWHAGNVVKYVLRYQHKARPLVDLEKAQWYLARLIARVREVDEISHPRPLTQEELERLVAEASKASTD